MEFINHNRLSNFVERIKEFPENYLHYFEQRSDTGLKLDLLQKYLFIPLDIFGQNIHNDKDAELERLRRLIDEMQE